MTGDWLSVGYLVLMCAAYIRLANIQAAQQRELSEMHNHFLWALDAERKQRQELLERLAQAEVLE